MKCLLVLLVGILAACDAPRPVGSYTPVEPDAGPANDNVVRPGDSTDDPEDDTASSDDSDVAPDDPAPGKDASTKPPKDAGAAVDLDGSSPYARLTGNYLMRMDMYSTVDTTSNGNRLWIDNRVSNLMFVSLREENGKLISDETLCDQTYQHVCGEGCTSWVTLLDVALGKTFFPKAKISREYKLVDGTLTADEATLPLGFTVDEPTAATPLPTSPSDPKVWKLAPGDPDPSRVGVRTVLEATLKSRAGVTAPFRCTVATVQRLTTSFSIGRIDTTNYNALVGTYYKLEASSSQAEPIFVQVGSGSSTLTKDLCTLENFKGQSSMKEVNAVKFKRVDDLVACPASGTEYDNLFKGSVMAPNLQ